MGDRRRSKKEVVVTVSGGFDPVHVGHVRLFEEAKKLGDKLVVILNNDHWLMKKKGYVFMPQRERKELIEALEAVDKVIITSHKPNPKDMSVSKELRKLKPDIFANGGDRTSKNTPEKAACKAIGCRMVYNLGRGGKVQSSSWLLNAFLNNSSGRDRKE
ncbi:MAG: adenylyltransferase/cytidyltransferase family protein [Candidatus Colwellbacteria bacterium]|nr:adenylyltransferase/cytidyltransferase family protein [Candidatus Colwellbacteria bacterium]